MADGEIIVRGQWKFNFLVRFDAVANVITAGSILLSTPTDLFTGVTVYLCPPNSKLYPKN